MRLQEGEQILHELRPESSLLTIWFFTKAIPAAVVGIFAVIWLFGVSSFFFLSPTVSDVIWSTHTLRTIAFVISPIFLIATTIYCFCLRRTYMYYITNQRCVFHGGIIRRVERSVPYHKITDVEMSQDIVERVLRISSLRIFTPGTASVVGYPFGKQRAEITFAGLKDNETPAATINQILRKFRATGE